MTGYPLSWTPSARGVLTGAPIYVADKTEAEITALGDMLRGAVVLASPEQTVFTLNEIAKQPAHTDRLVRIGGPEPPASGRRQPVVPPNALSALLQKLGAGATSPGIPAARDGDRRRKPATPTDAVPTIMVIAEHYNMLVRMMRAGVTPQLRSNFARRTRRATATATT